jgi:[ribosomal protein S18]-alanine N-acetyltransferase
MNLRIASASDKEKQWASELLANTDPWLELGIVSDQLIKVCFDPEYLIFIAHDYDDSCGVLIMDPRGIAGSPYIKSIAVASHFRCKGIGAQMISFAEQYFSKQSKHMFLCVSSFNHRARSFYTKLGYISVGEFQDYIKEGASEILMYKRIG